MAELLIVRFISLFLIGSILASFVNVLVDRIPQKISIIKGRSYCMSCGRMIKPHENIPVFSFFLLRGKCKGCGSYIPKRIVLVEIIGGFMTVGLYLFGLAYALPPLTVWFLIIVGFIFLWIFFTDIEYGIIPDQSNLLLVVVTFVYLVLSSPGAILEHMISGIIAFAFFFALFLVTKGRGMGFGDVKLSFALGFLLGYPDVLVAFYLAFLTGAFLSIILILCRLKNFKKDTVPFGPFLVAGSFLALLWGDEILTLFLQVLP